MERPDANCLYALATISVTFVGFSALLLVFRETIGGKMMGCDSCFTLSFMQAGFIATAGGLFGESAQQDRRINSCGAIAMVFRRPGPSMR
jgi:hypothetical protein